MADTAVSSDYRSAAARGRTAEGPNGARVKSRSRGSIFGACLGTGKHPESARREALKWEDGRAEVVLSGGGKKVVLL